MCLYVKQSELLLVVMKEKETKRKENVEMRE